MKYFFLSEQWVTGRVWATDGLWNDAQWRRKPQIDPLSITIQENGERLLLYRVEPAVLMVEVKPRTEPDQMPSPIGQVVLKRLMSADQALDRLAQFQTELEAIHA
ncbi:hypothetical protein IQ266_09065 [filamentous cyanobacterium LEGE 11480]|uniref:Uncharacterized protein n=1 Tax=Romeriopsis navalis LEGE 11480 TaxID=2777977 RepID=A0A928VNR4_9CYAN|nr:hypothetical protein [Romeriopsis navalis]MBE9029875.1 hypothetical protein [Romeriopsis navalis LEGE 11480]